MRSNPPGKSNNKVLLLLFSFLKKERKSSILSEFNLHELQIFCLGISDKTVLKDKMYIRGNTIWTALPVFKMVSLEHKEY